MPTEQEEDAFDPFTPTAGVIQPPNIDVGNIAIAGEGFVTGDSFSFGTPDGEILIPSIDERGTPLSQDEAMNRYYETGQHLGIYNSPQDADIFAQQLDRFQGGKDAKYTPYENLSDDEKLLMDLEEQRFGGQTAYSAVERRAFDRMENELKKDMPEGGVAGGVMDSPVEKEAMVPPEKRVYGTLSKNGPPVNQVPSLANYLSYATDQALNNASAASVYSEAQNPNLGSALKQTEDPIMNEIKNLANLPPRQRAIAGAKLGARIGLQQGGEQAGIVGAFIGAVAGRGAGMVQAGEYEKTTRDARLWNSLKTIGIAKDNGVVEFEGEKLQMPPTATDRLKNLKINVLNNARDRTLYELDKTNPLTGRAMLVARPLGLIYANLMLGYDKGNTEADRTASTASMAMFANIFQEGATSEDKVYSRARQTVKNMGLTEGPVRRYFDSIKTQVKMEEAEDIKRGLDILFAPEPKKKK